MRYYIRLISHNATYHQREFMFKYILSTALFTFITFTNASAFAIEFKEGKHYQVLQGKKSSKKEVTEYFSFYCPACFQQEPFMNKLKANLPKGAVFNKNHVDGMPGKNIEIEHALTKALITAKLLKVDEKIIPAIFKYRHVSKADFTNEKDIKNLFVINGVDKAKFDKTFASFSVNTQAKKMQKNTAALRSQGFTGVPTLVVNGIYKPLTTSIKTESEYQELVSYLINKN